MKESLKDPVRSERYALRQHRGQTVIEYLLTTLALVTFCAGMYGFMQARLKELFTKAGIKILMSYY